MRRLPTITISAIVLIAVACANSTSRSDNATSSSADTANPRFVSTVIPICKNPGSIETADFNHDGFPDLAIASGEDSSVMILLNTGHGQFTPAQGSPFAANRHPNDIAIADFNKDGNPDLAIANTETAELTILLGNGKGQFTPAPHSPYNVYSRPHTHGIAVGDFNGDGHLDLATDDWGENKVSIIFGDSSLNFGHQTFYPVGKRPYQRLRAADLNDDGKPDLITTNLESNNSTVLLGQGNGTFTEAPGSPFPCGDAPFAVAIGDLNGDGHMDLAIADAPTITSENTGRDGLFILLGDGTGRFQPLKGSPFPTGKSPSRIAIGDLNRDGINDVAVTNYNDKTITIFYLGRSGVVRTTTIPVGTRPDGICIGDFNKDGKNDIAVTNQEDGTLMILTGHQ
jgi:hypothetical protein